MRETTMKQRAWYLVAAVGVALALTSCSAKSPTAPKPTPQPTGIGITLTASPNPASVSETVLVVAQVTTGSANVPDGTAVTFDTSFGGFVDGGGATEVIRTTVAGRASTTLAAPIDSTTKKPIAGTAAVLARVQGTSASTQKSVAFQTIPPPTPTGLFVTAVNPVQGGMEGGDRVILTGGGFVQPVSVQFIVAGQPFQAAVTSVSPDGGTMNVTTPRVAANPPFTTNQPADVMVTVGANTVTLPGGGSSGFTYLAQVTTPTLYAINPNAGPFEGGTPVVITGVGFQYPVQVLFGTFQAQVTSSNYTEVDCVAPNITASKPSGPTPLSVTVTNTSNGAVSNAVPYTYGGTMYISAISPPVGPQDTATTVTIFGQGFVAPIGITIGGISPTTTWDVLSVAGTEIVARTRPLPDNARSCDNLPATVTVTNLDSGAQSNPTGTFTYQATRPLITSVEVDAGGNTVQQYVPGVCNTTWGSHTVTVKGSGFQSGMTVGFGNPEVGPVVATFVDSSTLTVQLPDLTAIPITTVACTNGSGTCGERYVATAIPVTVHNLHSSCSDTLNGAMVINPCDTTCRVTGITPTSFGAVIGSPSVGAAFTIPLNFTPSPSTTPNTVSLTYVGFSASPAQVTIPPSASPYPLVVTPSSAGSGAIIASVGSGTCQVSVTSGIVTVSPAPQLTVTLAGTIGSNTVTSAPSGISACATSCTASFTLGTPVTLTATASGTWSGDCSGTGTTASVTMNGNKTCTITFP
jgi:hypothetical protein